MSPIFLLALLIYFILMLMILIMMIFFFFMSLPSIKLNLVNDKKLMNWMW